jgi:glycosyltransferase involved in cell wall biosynthesis
MTNRQEGGSRRHGKLKRSESGKPLISVITATFNAARFLPDTIRSIREQSYPNIEWIVIDGGSTDATVDMLKANDDIIDFWLSERDRGIYSAWNKGLAQAKGEWICFLGADDYFWDAHALAQMIEQLEKLPSSMRVAYGQVMLISADGKVIHAFGEPWEKVRERFKQVMCIPHQGTMHRRSLFEQHGQFDESFRIAGDYELLLRELKSADARFIPGIIITAMRQGGGISSEPGNSLVVLRESRRAQRKNGLRLPGRLWLMAAVRLYLRLLLWKILGERLARKALDLGRRVMGLPPFWTRT